MQLSIIIPVYNECHTIERVLERLSLSGCSPFEWIIVDDGSTDGTTEILRHAAPKSARLIFKRTNEGKSAAVRSALAVANGDWVIIQDADLEYDPSEIPRLLNQGVNAQQHPVAVFGRRPSCWQYPSRWIFASGVLLIDVALFVFHRKWVRDHATCYKLVPRCLLRSFELQACGFEGCVEITSKLMCSGVPIVQIPITYSPRKASAGKKLTASYGFTALHAVWTYRNWKRPLNHCPSNGKP
jgi:glycosyltransferase involved in cell wall biosynthesis